MLLAERREVILNMIKENHTVTVDELSRKLYISETSARRDLNYLAQKGLVTRTYGGAIWASEKNRLLSLSARQKELKGAKVDIARKAVSLVKHGDVIFLDSSSTALELGALLPSEADLTVITNGARIAVDLVGKPGIKVYSTGGALMPNIYSYNGLCAMEMIEQFHADKFFVSPKAVKKGRGFFCTNEEETAVRRAMMKNSKETVMLCTARKLDNTAPFFLCDFESIDYFICDETLSEEWDNELKMHDVRVV